MTHSNTATSTLANLTTIPSHGKFSIANSEAMDVTEAQRLADTAVNKDIMDTTLDGTQNDIKKTSHAEEAPKTEVAPLQVLERPREDEDKYGALQSPSQMGKTPH